MTLAMTFFFLTEDLLQLFKERELGAKTGPKDLDNTNQRVANVREFLLLCYEGGVPRTDMVGFMRPCQHTVYGLYYLL